VEKGCPVDTLKVPATLEHFEDMMSFVRRHAKTAGFDDAGVNQIALASEEVLVNVIHYAYPETEGDLEVEVRKPAQGAGLEIIVRDGGVAFNPLEKEAPDISTPAEERPIGGLGIFMVQQIMDAVGYERRGAENVLTMTKRLT
jgi:anti-sigma regulatory factor (Ser/Thr protein kinase)